MDTQEILIGELKRLSKECRLHSRSVNSSFALMRVSNTINSLLSSLNEESISDENPLSKRETEILAHVSNGFTNREIAKALLISEKTIEYHLKSIFQKTHASKRAEAVTNALKNRWL